MGNGKNGREIFTNTNIYIYPRFLYTFPSMSMYIKFNNPLHLFSDVDVVDLMMMTMWMMMIWRERKRETDIFLYYKDLSK